jgi:4-hydroxyphenylacetate 3-monooxygenase
VRTGADYVAALADDREVYLDGERVRDVATHPAFSPAIQVVAGAYDAAREDPVGAWEDPESGETRSGMWRIPRSADDLRARRGVHEQWARASYGLMGRTPDHVASLLAAFAGSSDVFRDGAGGHPENVLRFFERASRDDLYVAYAIVPPQVDRSKPAHQQPEPFLYAGAAEEREDGIVIRGAQMLGTSSAMADWLLLTYVVPLQAGDEDYAISCVMPIATPGLKIYPRRPYSAIADTEFDYPLSSRFDEIDCLIVFDDVFVPWEQVFVYRDIALTRDQFMETGAHLMANFQSLSRFGVKLRFACGLALRLAQLHGIDRLPPVRGQLGGGVATIASQLEGLVVAAESSPGMRNGLAIPNKRFVYTGMSLQRQLVVDLMRWLRELAGGAFIAVPSSHRSFTSPLTAADTERYYGSASASAEERVRLLKLMWDFVGTEFAGRQLQYEMFYSAAQHVSDARVFDAWDWDGSLALVDDALARTRGAS